MYKNRPKKYLNRWELIYRYNTLRERNTPNWILTYFLDKALELIEKLDSVTINYIYREENLLVDELANIGVDGKYYKKVYSLALGEP